MIPMRPEFSALRFYMGDERTLERMPGLPAGEPFAPARIEFLNEVSRFLLSDREAKRYPDIVTFAFWIRRANMEQLKRRFSHNGAVRLGRGVAFLIAPSNVAVNYAYSFASGFVLGNANIVRLPSREFPQVKIINQAIRTAMDKCGFQDSLALVRYERNREINDCLSSICDVRVIWGGDATIQELRKSPLPPRAGEVTFADRYSICIVDAGAYLKKEEKEKVAAGFYNDTYLLDQNACTSPKLVCWMGNDADAARARECFWERLRAMVSSRYKFQPVQFVDKLESVCLAAVGIEGLHILRMNDNQITRVELEKIDPVIQNFKGNSGLFYEYRLRDILELVPLCNAKMQTIAFLGNREMLMPLLKCGVKGIDRVAEIGHTMDFDLIWDGYDLMERLTRNIRI